MPAALRDALRRLDTALPRRRVGTALALLIACVGSPSKGAVPASDHLR
jgi:hypothetical protein